MKTCFYLCLSLFVGGCVGTIDRVFYVEGSAVVPNHVSPEQCLVQLVANDGNVIFEDRMNKNGRAMFLNPPRWGGNFVSIKCSEHGGEYYGPFNFGRNWKIILQNDMRRQGN